MHSPGSRKQGPKMLDSKGVKNGRQSPDRQVRARAESSRRKQPGTHRDQRGREREAARYGGGEGGDRREHWPAGPFWNRSVLAERAVDRPVDVQGSDCPQDRDARHGSRAQSETSLHLPSAPRSTTEWREPNGSGVTPRTQSSIRSTVILTKIISGSSGPPGKCRPGSA